ncbi:hypothetical protein PBI_GRAYSON_112 [Rhodococcus phage Grayson]|jgi:hypothetical protein|nr:hypothetical protein PBI_GRAYSON_112 [Rhodococcus phage Grayson]
MRRKKQVASKEPYYYTDDIYEIPYFFKEQQVTSGTLFKLKNDRSIYVFESMYYNRAKDVEWINLRSLTNGDWKSVRPVSIKEIYIAKQSRRKKVDQ